MNAMTKTMSGLILAGALATGGSTAFADHNPPPVPRLTSIRIYHEHLGGHHLVGTAPISLNTAGTGSEDHMTFEIRGYDQWGRPMSSCSLHPVLIFPAGGQFGWMESLGNNHFRFWAGSVPVESVAVFVQVTENQALNCRINLTILNRCEAEAVHPHDSGFVPAGNPPVRVFAPAPVYPVAPSYPRWTIRSSRSGCRSDGFSFGFDSAGNFRFGLGRR
ncbi:MAG: hypothetical protein HYZ53_02385 [Planctomycetes bacterium]|nr:hypothetical protein [Planctomycetota bacterium]